MKFGKIQFGDGALLTDVLDGYSGVGGGTNIQYPAIDDYTVLNYKLNDLSAPFINSGNGGTLNLSIGNTNAPLSTQPGIINKCCFCNASNSSYLKSTATTIGESNNLTISFWLKINYHSAWACFLTKSYYLADDWTGNPMTIFFRQTDSANTIQIYFVINDVEVGSTITGFKVEYNKWIFLSATYNGSTFKAFKDGLPYYSNNVVGTISYGTHGRWFIMNNQINQHATGFIEDIRIESIARSDDYILNMYKSGVGLLR